MLQIFFSQVAAEATSSEVPDFVEPEPENITSVSVQSCPDDDLQNLDDDSAIIPSDETLQHAVPNQDEISNLEKDENNFSTEIIDYSSVPEYKVEKMSDNKSDNKSECKAVRQNQNHVKKDTQQQPSFNYESILKFVKNGEYNVQCFQSCIFHILQLMKLARVNVKNL